MLEGSPYILIRNNGRTNRHNYTGLILGSQSVQESFLRSARVECSKKRTCWQKPPAIGFRRLTICLNPASPPDVDIAS